MGSLVWDIACWCWGWFEDGYHSSLEGIGLDLEEGWGDSEDASVGAIDAFEGIHLNDSQGTISQGIGSQKIREKRKRINHTKKLS